MMLSREAAGQVLDILTPEDFYTAAHTIIYAALRRQYTDGKPLDPVALAAALLETGDLARVGGGTYLHHCLETVPTAANGSYYARMVRDLAVRRRIREAGIRIVQQADTPERPLEELCSRAQEEIFTATSPRHRQADISFGQALAEALDAIEADSQHVGLRGLPTYIGDLNRMTSGLRAGQLVVIAGRPGMGKSVFGLDLVRLNGISRDHPCQMFSLEMTRDEIFRRLLAAELSIPFTRLRDGRLGQDDWNLVMQLTGRVADAPVFIDDNPYVDMAYIRTVSRQRAATTGLAMIFVDYLQLISTPGRRESRQQEVSDMSRGLKLLAKELNCVVVAAAQLNRGPEQRSDKRPYLADLRESGAVEQDADIVILLHRPDYYDENDRPREADVIVAKQRNGPTGDIAVFADLAYMRFRDLER